VPADREIRRRAGRPGGLIVWSAMLVGAAVTLAANVAAATPGALEGGPGLVAQAMNAWPPLAFLFAVELLVIAFRPDPAGAVRGLTEADDESVDDEAPATDDDIVAALCKWAAEEGAMPSRERVRVKFGIGARRSDRVRAAAALADQEDQRGGVEHR